jgi:hypothetical protein
VNSPELLARQYNQVWQRTYMTFMGGVRVYFYVLAKNRWGKSGDLIVRSEETRVKLSWNALVIDEVEGAK